MDNFEEVDFEYDEDLGMTNTEFEKKIAKYIKLQKEIAHLMGAPSSEYDTVLDKPYLLYPDGRREYR